MKSNENFGKYYEEFQVGEVIIHNDVKTIHKSDSDLFCELTINNHPLHIDPIYAEKTDFGKCIVAGTYILSLVVGISVKDISYKAIANLGYSNIKHHLPVFMGDTISAETETLSVRSSKTRKNCGIVQVETRAFNQKGQKVLTLQRQILIPKKGKNE
ncbi:MAG: MaoC family dehydratase [Candidatus Cloacimonetes bacterium]|nr:MaoC family dehydratase [Candidatus Cloacimonadota bacterium]